MARARPRQQPAWLALACLSLLGCGRIERLQACNISTEDCQQDIYYAVIRLRGDGWDPFNGLPPIRTITRDQYRAELTAEKNARPPADPNAKPMYDPRSVALQLLGLITPTKSAAAASVDSDVSNVIAFYSSATRVVTVISHTGPRDDDGDTRLLAHELVHAFQSSELSDDVHGSTSDGHFTADALIEGEAVLYEHLAGAEMDDVQPQQLDWPRKYREQTSGRRSSVPKTKSPFYAVSWFVYPLGAGLQTKAWLDGGNVAVRELAEHFPTRSVDLMAANDNTQAGRAPALSCSIDSPRASFKRTTRDRYGAMQLYAFLNGAAVDEPTAWRLGKLWRDDTIWIYGDSTAEQTGVSWRIRMADQASANAVVEAASSHTVLRAERISNDALIVGVSDDSLRTWPGARDCR